MDLGFEGVPLKALIDHLRPHAEWVCLFQVSLCSQKFCSHLAQVSADGYTSNIFREDAELVDFVRVCVFCKLWMYAG